LNWPVAYKKQVFTPSAGAGNQRFFDRTNQDTPFRMVGFQATTLQNAESAFAFSVRTSQETLFLFMNRQGVGVVGSTTRMTWKDSSTRPRTVALDETDALIPYLDIPAGGGLQLGKVASAEAVAMTVTVVGFELTKNVLARILLGTNPETINYMPDGEVSIANLTPEFEAQGGGVVT